MRLAHAQGGFGLHPCRLSVSLPLFRTKLGELKADRTLTELDHWHELHIEPVLEPRRAIVDAHHHLWLRPPQSYQLSELIGDISSGHEVRSTVFVQNTAMYRASGPEEMRPLGETEYVNGIAAMSESGLFGPTRACAAIIGFADLTLGPAVRPVLEAHKAITPRFKGVRQQAQWDAALGSLASTKPPPGLLAMPQFRAGFARLVELGLSFDAWVFFHQLGEVAALADAFPSASIIVNHLGGPLGIGQYAGRRTQVYEAWAKNITELARRENVTMKIGGLGMPIYGFGFDRGPEPPNSANLAKAWRPYVMHAIEAFGAGRAMLESNFPVDKASCSYRTLWNAFKRLCRDASEDEKSALFEGTARRVYDLGCEDCEN